MQYIGSLVGDYCGSIYEWNNVKTESPDDIDIMKQGMFTDDSVLSVAIMDWLNKTEGKDKEELINCLKNWTRAFEGRGYGRRYKAWALSDDRNPINSFGNGSAMRVSPCAFYANTLEECLDLAKISAEVTHNHEEGIKGAQAIAEAIYLARCGAGKEGIKNVIQKDFNYDLSKPIKEIGTNVHTFDGTCQVTVPEAIICFLNSHNFLDCIRTSIWIGGDTDTMGAMSGGIAEAFYGIPSWVEEKIKEELPSEMKKVITEFNTKMLSR